jgi:hypothetical protein
MWPTMITSLALLLFFTCSGLYSDEPPAASDGPIGWANDQRINSLFEGKIVGLSIDRSSAVESKTSSSYLTDVEILKVGGRFFIVGSNFVPDHPDYEEYGPTRGITIAVAWEKVTGFKIYSKEQFDEYLKFWIEQSEE